MLYAEPTSLECWECMNGVLADLGYLSYWSGMGNKAEPLGQKSRAVQRCALINKTIGEVTPSQDTASSLG